MAAGRPNTYDKELCIEICNQVAEGNNIKTVLSDTKYPSFQTWCNWKRNNSELLDLYVNAIQDKAESVDEEIDLVLRELKSGNMEASVANVIIQTYKWKAAKYYPKMFGDKQAVDHTTNGKDMPGTTIDASKLSNEALEELLKAQSGE